MGYFEAIIDGLLEGKKYRRKEWPNDGTFICMNRDYLSIWMVKEKEFHSLLVSTGDLEGTDWEEYEPISKSEQVIDIWKMMEDSEKDTEDINLMKGVEKNENQGS